MCYEEGHPSVDEIGSQCAILDLPWIDFRRRQDAAAQQRIGRINACPKIYVLHSELDAGADSANPIFAAEATDGWGYGVANRRRKQEETDLIAAHCCGDCGGVIAACQPYCA